MFMGKDFIDFGALKPQLLAVPAVGWWTIDLCYWPRAWGMVETSHKSVADLLAAG